jgi:hypothetical protein
MLVVRGGFLSFVGTWTPAWRSCISDGIVIVGAPLALLSAIGFELCVGFESVTTTLVVPHLVDL